jgi:hypothetical protein
MGLDMFLVGEKLHWPDVVHPEHNRSEDGFEVDVVKLRLGYWRKHPNLHGYIVQAFGDGKDECQKIHLNDVEIKATIRAVKEKRLPHTEGFFFGQSEETDEQITYDVTIFERALKWLEGSDELPVIMNVPDKEVENLNEGLSEIGIAATSFKLRKPQHSGQSVTRVVVYNASW